MWFMLAPISVWETTSIARVECRQAASWIEAEVSGRVHEVPMVLGQTVRAGQVLVVLDSTAQGLELAVLQARRQALEGQLAILHEQVDAERLSMSALRNAGAAAVDEAGARLAGAEAHAQLTAEEIERIRRAYAAGQISELERLRLEAEADKARAARDAAELEQHRLHSQQGAEQERRQARLAQLKREAGELKGRVATTQAACDRLHYEIGRRSICAPVDGTIADMATLRAGTVVSERARLATIVPAEELRLVAEYLPSSAFGRIRAGQRARLRLDGFPWGQYGSLGARVAAVASEVRHGYVRVDLDLDDAASTPVTLQHGLTGTVEVEVERIPPATLMLRSLARLLAGSSALLALAGPSTTIQLSIRGYRLEVEVAADPVRRALGLMWRKQLPESQGMLFVHPRADRLSFWMRNTYVPLSIAFLDAQRRVINIEDLEPLDESGHSSAGPAWYALEVRRGWFEARGIIPGDLCEFTLPLGLSPR